MSAANFDIHSMIELLKEQFDITVITQKTNNTVIPKDIGFLDVNHFNITNHDSFDALVMFNGNVNAFGGVEPADQIAAFRIINSFPGRVFYINTDGNLLLKQVWPLVSSKGWNWTEKDISVERKDIIYLTQARNIDKLDKEVRKQRHAVPIQRENLVHFPIEQAILAQAKDVCLNEHRTIDLMYGGSPRGGKRKKEIEKFYSHSDLNVEVFGALTPKVVNLNAKFSGRVPFDQVIKKMSGAKATCIIGDPFYKDNFHTLRIYESILAGCVTFIDKSFDPDYTIFKNERLRKFLYVSNGTELRKKIKLLTEDMMAEIRQYQINDIEFERNEYIAELCKCITERL